MVREKTPAEVKVLGLDVATETGACVFRGGEPLFSVSLRFKKTDLTGALNQFRDLLENHHPDLVVVEDVPRAFAGSAAFASYVRWRTILQLALEEQARPPLVREIKPSALKKFAGYGHYTKDQMLAAARSKWPDLGWLWKPGRTKADRKRHTDRVDALWLASWGWEHLRDTLTP